MPKLTENIESDQETKSLTQIIKDENTTFQATYSPEDNKLRFYTPNRLSEELFAWVRHYGFSYARHQELFVCTRWSPGREDFCISLAGFVQKEKDTLIDRAEFRAARFDGYLANNMEKANRYQMAAQELANSYDGQPILEGHHSQRKAQKSQRQIDSAEKNAGIAASKVDYWSYKAEGVERYANMKSDPTTRFNRIKVLLKDLRTYQRAINHGHYCLEVWKAVQDQEDLEKQAKQTLYYAGAWLKNGSMSPDNSYSDLSNGKVTAVQVIEGSIKMANNAISSTYYQRVITHTLNRLGYEYSELELDCGKTSRYEGVLTATIIKTFARTHGTDSPKVAKEGGTFTLSEDFNLPRHLSPTKSLSLEVDQWRDLMVSVGYEVPAKKPAKPPILNFKCDSVMILAYGGKAEELKQIELTKEEYSKRGESRRGVRLSSCKQFRIKVCDDPTYSGAWYSCPSVAVFMSDSKVHPMPDSESIAKCQVAEDLKEALEAGAKVEAETAKEIAEESVKSESEGAAAIQSISFF